MAVQRAISLYDLMNYEQSKKAIIESDKDTLEKVLYSCGLDVAEYYELEICLHRPLTRDGNEPWFGGRYVGCERQDEDYMKSGNSSWENEVDSVRDYSLKGELARMSRQASSEKAFIDEGAGKRAVKEDKEKYS